MRLDAQTFLLFPSLVFFHFQEFQDQIKAVSFKDVVVSGRELSGALITALINVYIKDSACVDTVSVHLRDICPLLYSSDDSTCSKVPFSHNTHNTLTARRWKNNLRQLWERNHAVFFCVYVFNI